MAGLHQLFARSHIFGYPKISADNRSVADIYSTQNGCVGVYYHIIADNGVARHSFYRIVKLISVKAACAECHTLVNLYVVANN